jgi:hypothetical protein
VVDVIVGFFSSHWMETIGTTIGTTVLVSGAKNLGPEANREPSRAGAWGLEWLIAAWLVNAVFSAILFRKTRKEFDNLEAYISKFKGDAETLIATATKFTEQVQHSLRMIRELHWLTTLRGSLAVAIVIVGWMLARLFPSVDPLKSRWEVRKDRVIPALCGLAAVIAVYAVRREP